MKKSLIILFVVSIFTFSCSNDDGGSGNKSSNFYKYNNVVKDIVLAEYLFVDDDVYLFFKGTGNTAYLQVIFAEAGLEIPVGNFEYNSDRFSENYNPAKNFWSGSVTDFDNQQLLDQLNGGTIKISKTGTEDYEVTFNMQAQSGTITGNYKGKFVAR